MSERKLQDFFGKPISAINIGLTGMADALKEQNIPVTQLDWHPPIGDVPRLFVTKKGVDIEKANLEACARIKQAKPILVGLGIAKDIIPGMHKKLFLHAGPPITWGRSCF